jgi:hypothetical protein
VGTSGHARRVRIAGHRPFTGPTSNGEAAWHRVRIPPARAKVKAEAAASATRARGCCQAEGPGQASLEVGVSATSCYRLVSEFVQRSAADPRPVVAPPTDEVSPSGTVTLHEAIGPAGRPVEVGHLALVVRHRLLGVLAAKPRPLQRHKPPAVSGAGAEGQRWSSRSEVTGTRIAAHRDVVLRSRKFLTHAGRIPTLHRQMGIAS